MSTTEAAYITLYADYPSQGFDEYGNDAERGISKEVCCCCGKSAKKKRPGWFIGPGGMDDFYCDRCVETYMPDDFLT